MRKGFASNARLSVLSLAILLCFAALAARLVSLHWLERDSYLAFIEKARKQTIPDLARRGDILDSRGNRLATSRNVVELGADPQELRREEEGRWPELARLLGLPRADLDQLLRRRFAAPDDAEGEGVDSTGQGRPVRWVKLSEEVEESTYDQIRRLNVKGVYGNRRYKRAYPGSIAPHVLGFINKEGTAVTGVERYMDFYLRGQDGWRESERDGHHRELAQFRSREIPAADGFDVVLTIDSFAQTIVEKELAEIARKFQPESATIIVSDPATGALLALANWPTFDLNEFNQAPLANQRNIAITDSFEPGSTFKIVAASGALNEGIVSPATVFDCSLTAVDYDGKPRSLPAEAHGNYGRLTVAEIVIHSSNKGAAQLGVRLGAERLHHYAQAFGFGDETGFPFGGEVGGVLHPVAAWDGLTITRLPMGHAVSATPLQIHAAMGVIASGGVLIRPWVLSEIRDHIGRRVAGYEPLPRRRVITRATAETMARLLIEAASAEGTGKNAAIDGYQVAGKTGTAQKIINGQYSKTHHVGTFVGFFPADHPQLLMTVVVNDGHVPTGGPAFGGTVAAPSFKHIGEQLIPYLGIQAEPTVPLVRPVFALGEIQR
jgi:cell division protein FtsI/penicillin-binding protein 2